VNGEPEPKPKSSWAHWIDAILAIVAALIAYFAHNEELAALFALFGGLIVVSRLIFQNIVAKDTKSIREQIEKSLAPLEQLKRVIDLQQSSRIAEINQLLQLYLSITEKEFRTVKDSILLRTTGKLQRLAVSKVSDDLTTSEYYQWLLPMLADTSAGEKIRAVSIMHLSEWDESPVETQFLQQNIEAAERGVVVERVFVAAKDTLTVAPANPAITLHSEAVENGLNGYVVEREWLQSHDNDLLKQAGEGMIILGTRVALVDKFTPTGEARGWVTMDSTEIARLIDIFERLKMNSRPLKAPALNAALAQSSLTAPGERKLLSEKQSE